MFKRVNTLTAMFLVAGLAQAEIIVTEPVDQAPSCKEARETAWFLGELARTDGNVNPEVPYIACDTDRADAGGVVQAVSFQPEGMKDAEGPSCKEARQTAWFLAELARTDGNVNPEVPYVACASDREHYAEFGLDAN